MLDRHVQNHIGRQLRLLYGPVPGEPAAPRRANPGVGMLKPRPKAAAGSGATERRD